MHHVEILLTAREIDHFGKDRAIAELTFMAWYIALKDTRPAHSLTLVSTEIYDGGLFGMPGQRYRFHFRAD